MPISMKSSVWKQRYCQENMSQNNKKTKEKPHNILIDKIFTQSFSQLSYIFMLVIKIFGYTSNKKWFSQLQHLFCQSRLHPWLPTQPWIKCCNSSYLQPCLFHFCPGVFLNWNHVIILNFNCYIDLFANAITDMISSPLLLCFQANNQLC